MNEESSTKYADGARKEKPELRDMLMAVREVVLNIDLAEEVKKASLKDDIVPQNKRNGGPGLSIGRMIEHTKTPSYIGECHDLIDGMTTSIILVGQGTVVDTNREPFVRLGEKLIMLDSTLPVGDVMERVENAIKTELENFPTLKTGVAR